MRMRYDTYATHMCHIHNTAHGTRAWHNTHIMQHNHVLHIPVALIIADYPFPEVVRLGVGHKRGHVKLFREGDEGVYLLVQPDGMFKSLWIK